MNRRQFLGTAAGAGLAGLGLAACAGTGSAAPGRRQLDRIGVQLYTVRDRMQQSVPDTLAAVAETGFREVETAGFFDLTPAQFRAELDRVGLASPAGHVPIQALRENRDATLAAARTLGQQWVVVPWLDQGERTVDGYRRVAGELNAFGAAARDQGIRVGYHNHDFEFEPLAGGRNGMDILIGETDPELVDIELDLYWAVRAGHDPVDLFNAHPGRFPLCHVKDMADMQGERRMVSVGEGGIDFGRIFSHAEVAGLRHFFVEHDNPQDSLASIRTGYAHLRQLAF